MSVDYQARLCYGYIFPKNAVDMDYLDQKAYLVCDVVDDFDAYESFFAVNEWDSKSNIFIGRVINKTYNDYEVIIPQESFDQEKNDKILQKILELFAVDLCKAYNAKPKYYLINHCW